MLKYPPQLIVILGPTATGKTKLAVRLAKKNGDEIISADSRQVYKYMNIGTGKDLAEYGVGKNKVEYHLIDIIKPTTEFNVAKFKTKALKAVENISRRGKVPFLAGGSGLYISAIVENYNIPEIKPDLKLRKKLEATSLSKLVAILKKNAWGAYKRIDLKNKRRVVRALEIVLCDPKRRAKKRIQDRATPILDPLFSPSFNKSPSGRNAPRGRDVLILGTKIDRETLKQKIDQRVDKMIKQGLIQEVKKLHEKHKVPWKKLEGFGMEYKYPALYLRGKIGKAEMLERIKTTNYQFAKRQLTWFRGMQRRGVKINWVENYKEAEGLIGDFV